MPGDLLPLAYADPRMGDYADGDAKRWSEVVQAIRRLQLVNDQQDSSIDSVAGRVSTLEGDSGSSLWIEQSETSDTSVTVQTSTSSPVLNDSASIVLSTAGVYLINWSCSFKFNETSNHLVSFVAKFTGRNSSAFSGTQDVDYLNTMSNTTPTRYLHSTLASSSKHTSLSDGETVYVSYGVGVGSGALSNPNLTIKTAITAVKVA